MPETIICIECPAEAEAGLWCDECGAYLCADDYANAKRECRQTATCAACHKRVCRNAGCWE